MPLPVEVHLPAELAVPPGILAGHVVGVVAGAGLDAAGVQPAGLDGGDEAGVVAGGEEEGLAAGGGEGVAEAGEDEEEEEGDEAEEDGDHEVQELPLARAPLRRGQAQVPHAGSLSPNSGHSLSLAFFAGSDAAHGSSSSSSRRSGFLPAIGSDLIKRASDRTRKGREGRESGRSLQL